MYLVARSRINITIPTLVVFCGAPGSGKTTLSKKIAEEHNAELISFDELQCVYYTELIPLVIDALNNGKNVVVDSLCIYRRWRQTILDATNQLECERVLLCMTTSMEECMRRNAQRPTPLPSEMIQMFYETIEQPTLEEGWDEIIYY